MIASLQVANTTKTAIVDSAAATAATAKSYPWTARVVADCAAHVKIGGTATASDFPLVANYAQELAVGAGQSVSVIAATGASGNVWVSEVRHSS